MQESRWTPLSDSRGHTTLRCQLGTTGSLWAVETHRSYITFLLLSSPLILLLLHPHTPTFPSQDYILSGGKNRSTYAEMFICTKYIILHENKRSGGVPGHKSGCPGFNSGIVSTHCVTLVKVTGPLWASQSTPCWPPGVGWGWNGKRKILLEEKMSNSGVGSMSLFEDPFQPLGEDLVYSRCSVQ